MGDDPQNASRDDPPTPKAASGSSAAWRRQMIGALAGAVIALTLSFLIDGWGWGWANRTRYLLWGGVIGGLIGASEKLASAGKGLTKRDEDWLNILVALVGMAILSALIYGLTVVISSVLGPLLPR